MVVIDIEYQKELVSELRVYPRVAFFILRESNFRRAKMFFGEDRYQVCMLELVLADSVMDYLKEFINNN
jgi:hypothetical protein